MTRIPVNPVWSREKILLERSGSMLSEKNIFRRGLKDQGFEYEGVIENFLILECVFCGRKFIFVYLKD